MMGGKTERTNNVGTEWRGPGQPGVGPTRPPEANALGPLALVLLACVLSGPTGSGPQRTGRLGPDSGRAVP